MVLSRGFVYTNVWSEHCQKNDLRRRVVSRQGGLAFIWDSTAGLLCMFDIVKLKKSDRRSKLITQFKFSIESRLTLSTFPLPVSLVLQSRSPSSQRRGFRREFGWQTSAVLQCDNTNVNPHPHPPPPTQLQLSPAQGSQNVFTFAKL